MSDDALLWIQLYKYEQASLQINRTDSTNVPFYDPTMQRFFMLSSLLGLGKQVSWSTPKVESDTSF